METTGENSGTLCHERHVGDEDERDGERDGEGEEEAVRGKDGELTRMMCVSQQEISMPPVGINVTWFIPL